MKKTIRIKCQGSGMAKLDSLKILQGDLKDLSDESGDKLRRRIETFGFDAPIFTWDGYILDGTQRYKVLQTMIADGWKLPYGKVPVVNIEAESVEDAKARILGYVSQFGRITENGYDQFIVDLRDLDVGLIDLPPFKLDEIALPDENVKTQETTDNLIITIECKPGTYEHIKSTIADWESKYDITVNVA